MAPKKRKKKRERGRFLPLGREAERARTESVKYRVLYRDPKTGHFAKFRSGKILVPEIWADVVRLDKTKKKSIKFSEKVGQVAKKRKAKNPVISKVLARKVEKDVLKRKAPKKKLDVVDDEVVIRYPTRRRAKEGEKIRRRKKKKSKVKKKKRSVRKKVKRKKKKKRKRAK